MVEGFAEVVERKEFFLNELIRDVTPVLHQHKESFIKMNANLEVAFKVSANHSEAITINAH
jgi:hypothetical protein